MKIEKMSVRIIQDRGGRSPVPGFGPGAGKTMRCRRGRAVLILAFSTRFPTRVRYLLGQHLVNNLLKITPFFLGFPCLPRLRVYGDNHLIFIYLKLSPRILKFPQIRAENPRVGGSIPSPATIKWQEIN